MFTLTILCVCIFPALVIPAIIGFSLRSRNYDDFTRMATLLTLKPIIATPIWFLLYINTDITEGQLAPGYYTSEIIPPAYLLTLLPGLSLTLIILIVCRRAFGQAKPSSLLILIGLDCVSWLTSFAMRFPWDEWAFRCWLPIIVLLMPSIYARIAQALADAHTKAKLESDVPSAG